MASLFQTKVISLSKIQVSRSRLRRKNVTELRKAMQAIRKDGQPRPLIVDPDGRLLADTPLYLALKALGYNVVQVVALKDPSAALVRSIGCLLDRREAIHREAVAFNVALASLDTILGADTWNLVLDLWPMLTTDIGVVSLRLLPVLASYKRDHTPSDV